MRVEVGAKGASGTDVSAAESMVQGSGLKVEGEGFGFWGAPQATLGPEFRQVVSSCRARLSGRTCFPVQRNEVRVSGVSAGYV